MFYNVLTDAVLRVSMSGLHSLRPFLHTCVIVVALILSIVPTERAGHTPLSHYHRGSTTVNLMWTTGNVEVLFYVINVRFFFSLTYVMDQSLLKCIQVKQIYIISLFKQKGDHTIMSHRDYDIPELY